MIFNRRNSIFIIDIVFPDISSNIVHAVEQSRRTILIISPDYVGSIWTRLEYQVAQQEMLRMRHKIIPIIYREIKHMTNLDPNLRMLLDSVTYLQWPGESAKSKGSKHFWKSLQNALDKPCHNKMSPHQGLFDGICTSLDVEITNTPVIENSKSHSEDSRIQIEIEPGKQLRGTSRGTTKGTSMVSRVQHVINREVVDNKIMGYVENTESVSDNECVDGVTLVNWINDLENNANSVKVDYVLYL